MARINLMKEMNGNECWTNAFGDRFGERVCVGIEKGKCIHEGKSFKPSKEEIKDLWNDFAEQELGSPSQRMKDLEEEFGKEKDLK